MHDLVVLLHFDTGTTMWLALRRAQCLVDL